jgi:hypothetical protein
MKQFDNIPRKNPFKVPEGYFNEVNRKIIISATQNMKQPAEKVSTLYRLRPFILAAASVAAFLLIGYTALRIIDNSRHHLRKEMMTEETLAPFMNDIDIYSLEESAESIAAHEKMPETRKNEIIDYLLLENIDINEIYEQL